MIIRLINLPILKKCLSLATSTLSKEPKLSGSSCSYRFCETFVVSLSSRDLFFPQAVIKIYNLTEPRDVSRGSTTLQWVHCNEFIDGERSHSHFPALFQGPCILIIEYTAPYIGHWLSIYTSLCRTIPNHTECCPQTNCTLSSPFIHSIRSASSR